MYQTADNTRVNGKIGERLKTPHVLGPALSARGNLVPWPRPWRGFTHGPSNTATCPMLGCYKTPETMAT